MEEREARPESGVCRTETLWIPFLVGEMKGPSQWAPRDSEPWVGSRDAPEGPRNGRAFGMIVSGVDGGVVGREGYQGILYDRLRPVGK